MSDDVNPLTSPNPLNPQELLAEVRAEFSHRTFSAGLAIAFIDFLTFLNSPAQAFDNFGAFLDAFPQQPLTNTGVRANTLIVMQPNLKTISIRPFYNAAERLFRATYHRFDYPTCPGHATHAWRDYTRWLDALVRLDSTTLASLRQRIVDFVLSQLPDQGFNPDEVRREIPIFREILEGFPVTVRGREKTGAAYQGIVFGFIRADNPHLQVITRKVRSGAAREGGIGDIDCWDGTNLAISAEVKQYIISQSTLEDFAGFANDVNRRGAIGIVVALDFDNNEVREQIEALGLRAISRRDLIAIVELWDPIKQKAALSALEFYARHIEKSSDLLTRLRDYLESVEAGSANTVS